MGRKQNEEARTGKSASASSKRKKKMRSSTRKTPSLKRSKRTSRVKPGGKGG
tara:strand:- start:405 stop:560 length:156 start_codon:yes stop_codon:yes gene_type:complete